METLEHTRFASIDRAQEEILTVHQALGRWAVYGLGSKLIEIDKAVMSGVRTADILPIDLIEPESTLDHRIEI